MTTHLLVLAPAVIFVTALALALELPQRIKSGLARLRSRSLVPVR